MSARITFANVIRPVKCSFKGPDGKRAGCGHAWGIGCDVRKAGSTYCPKCRATVPLGRRESKR